MNYTKAQPHRLVSLYKRLSKWPMGRYLFSKTVCFRAPYFGSIKPVITQLDHAQIEVQFKKRRSVQNHIGTVHAIAMANACELAAGVVCEVSVPRDRRWIPKGMTIQYLQKATTDLTAKAKFDAEFTPGESLDVVIPVEVLDRSGQLVVSADITMYVSPRPA